MDETATMNPAQLFNYLWTTKYAKEIEERMALESQRKAESFVDATLTVCGEEIRLMTPRDLLLLDGFENPFVTCKTIPTAKDCAFFVWVLSVANAGNTGWMNRRRQALVYRRMARRDVAFNVAEIEEYCSRVFIDVPAKNTDEKGNERKPPSVYFLAGLLGGLACDMGPIDPMGGKLLSDTPIPRLLQYVKSVAKHKNRDEDETTEFDSQRSRCLEQVNLIMAQRRKAS